MIAALVLAVAHMTCNIVYPVTVGQPSPVVSSVSADGIVNYE